MARQGQDLTTQQEVTVQQPPHLKGHPLRHLRTAAPHDLLYGFKGVWVNPKHVPSLEVGSLVGQVLRLALPDRTMG